MNIDRELQLKLNKLSLKMQTYLTRQMMQVILKYQFGMGIGDLDRYTISCNKFWAYLEESGIWNVVSYDKFPEILRKAAEVDARNCIHYRRAYLCMYESELFLIPEWPNVSLKTADDIAGYNLKQKSRDELLQIIQQCTRVLMDRE